MAENEGFLMKTRRGRKGFSDGPMFEPPSKCKGGDFQALSPSGETKGSTVVSNITVAPSVTALFNLCHPSTIVRLIIAVVVVALNFQSRWAWPHISKKCLERIAPLVAHGNAARTIFHEVFRLFVKAASFGGFPRSIFSGSMLTRLTVCKAMSPCKFFFKATAAPGVTRPNILTRPNPDFPACATTDPSGLPSFNLRGSFQNKQPTKGLPGYVYQFSTHGSYCIRNIW